MKTKILQGEEALLKIEEGADIAYKAVRGTLGSSSRSAVVRMMGNAIILNDGYWILRSIYPEDPFASLSFELVRQASISTNTNAGDGTTTSAIFCSELIKKGIRNKNIDRLIPQLVSASELVIKKLNERTQIADTTEKLQELATVSCDSKEIGALVVDAVTFAGETGKIIVEETINKTTTVEKGSGLEIDNGFMLPSMITHPNRMEAVLEDAVVLVTEKILSAQTDMFPWLMELYKDNKKKVVIIARNVDGQALEIVAKNKEKGFMDIVVVKAPAEKDKIDDIAKFTGATFITFESGIKEIKPEHLGTVKKFIATQKKTTLVKADLTEDKQKQLTDRIDGLKNAVEFNSKDEESKDRLARLTGLVVTIKVGAPTHADMVHTKLKVDDAVGAIKMAKKDGYVTGGGLTLLSICKEVDNELKNDGSALLLEASKEPIACLVRNSGVEMDWSKINDTDGFNTNTKEYESDLIKKGIIDPVVVTKNVVLNSVSLASKLIGVDTLSAEIEEPVKTNV